MPNVLCDCQGKLIIHLKISFYETISSLHLKWVSIQSSIYAKTVYLTIVYVFFSKASLDCNVFLGLLLMHTFHPSDPVRNGLDSGIARPGATRACALPSTFQTLPSPAKQESCDSITNLTRKQMHYWFCNASFSVCMQHVVYLSISTL